MSSISLGESPSPDISVTSFPVSPSLEEQLDRFWFVGPEFGEAASVPEDKPGLALLERLGPSPFERGGFPVIGFLATTYDKVSRYALARR